MWNSPEDLGVVPDEGGVQGQNIAQWGCSVTLGIPRLYGIASSPLPELPFPSGELILKVWKFIVILVEFETAP